MPDLSRSPWLPYSSFDSKATMRMFCFSFAGGGASTYRQWPKLFSPFVEVHPIELPGRETRLKERPIERFFMLVHHLVDALYPYLDKPFCFFGHSVGAILGYEVARALIEQIDVAPAALIVSGSTAPQLRNRPEPLHLMSDEDFVQALKRFDGTPESVLQNKELMELMLPILRADFTLDETYTFSYGQTLSCPIYALAGAKDTESYPESIKPWRELTSGIFEFCELNGNHFFVNDLSVIKPALDTILEDITARHQAFLQQGYRHG